MLVCWCKMDFFLFTPLPHGLFHRGAVSWDIQAETYFINERDGCGSIHHSLVWQREKKAYARPIGWSLHSRPGQMSSARLTMRPERKRADARRAGKCRLCLFLHLCQVNSDRRKTNLLWLSAVWRSHCGDWKRNHVCLWLTGKLQDENLNNRCR